MDFDDWHHKQLNGDADRCPHEAWERKAWDAACEAAAALAEETAAGRDAEAIAEAILMMRSNVNLTGGASAEFETEK